ncbi:MAG: F0F1 ATP synthase subunit B [Rhodospirillales bacterium CG15_BIG_FIL_POST_REV_8_21_14_020_66_15]|nr:MAG: F0F1 ATP synthase subunit B [Rhodospirillales bacterium CG15_BIG_FIL_POST_REV_8_21_14_020_66_15]
MLHDPTFWVATAFAAFVGLLVYLKLPGKIGGALDERADKIRADIEEAEKLREEAQKLLADYQKKQRDAQKEAAKIVSAAKEEANRLAKQGEQRLKDSLARREKQAMDRLAQAETAAMEQLKAHTVDVAMAATRQVLAGSIKGKKADQLIDDAIDALPGKLH